MHLNGNTSIIISYAAAPTVAVASMTVPLPELIQYGMYSLAAVWYCMQIYDWIRKRRKS